MELRERNRAAAEFGDGTAATATAGTVQTAPENDYIRKPSRETLEHLRWEREQRRCHRWFESYAKRHGTTLAAALRGGRLG